MLRKGEYIYQYVERIKRGDCTDAERYVCSLPDFEVKQCGDFDIEDIERAYEAGLEKGKQQSSGDTEPVDFTNADTRLTDFCNAVLK